MKRFKTQTTYLVCIFMLSVFSILSGCSGGSEAGGGVWNQPPAAGAAGAAGAPVVPAPTIVPGAACSAASGPTIPTVTSSNPTSGNLFVTTSTAGVAASGKLITATFSLAMNPATINSATAPLTFTVKDNTLASNIAGTVTMDATNKIATFTTTAALTVNTSYTATITNAAKSAGGIAIACPYEWSFKTAVAPPATGLAPVNLGLADPFGIAATAGVSNTGATTINGDVVLDPVAGAICNSVAVDGAGGFGLCGGFPPTINGQVISPLFPDAGLTSGAVKVDLLAAFLSITPLAGPPAAGSLGGATPIAAGTTLGDLTGNPYVLGDNYFTPGTYESITSILVTDDLTFDAQGDPDAIFVMQSSTTIGTADGAIAPGVHTRILLVGGAKASNIYWQAGTSATLGLYSEFQGNILASASITMKTGASSCGRLLAGAFTAGAFVFDTNIVSVPGNVNAPATCK